MQLSGRFKLYVALAAIFISALVVGDTVSGKLIEFRGFDTSFVLSVGMVPFPVTFVITDLLNEFYGKQATRFVTWVGLAMAIFTLIILTVAVALPPAPFTLDASWDGTTPSAYANVFGGSRRILLASMTAYVVGQLLDISIFNYLKRLTNNRYLWLRATGSTLVSQFLDTVVVQILAWSGILAFDKIVSIVLTSYVMKILIAVGLTPVIYAGHSIVERWLKIEPIRLDAEGEPVGSVEPSS